MSEMPLETPRNSASRFAHVDAMRAFSVLIVVVAHAGLGHVVPGGSGVTIFFTISGFIITYLLLKERARTGTFAVKAFYARRALKILPPLLLLTLIPGLVYGLLHGMDWAAFAGQAFFVYNWFRAQGLPDVLPGSSVVWSLSVEEQFYIAWAVIWMVMLRRGSIVTNAAIVAIATAALSVAARIYLVEQGAQSSSIYYGTITRLDGIAIGVLTALYLSSRELSGRRVPPHFGRAWVLGIAIVMYLLSLAIRDPEFRYTFRFSLQSLAAALVILYGFAASSGVVRTVFVWLATRKTVALIGLSSYSIYLAHYPIIKGIREAAPDLSQTATFAVGVVAGVAVGIVVYLAVEVPLHRRLRPLIRG